MNTILDIQKRKQLAQIVYDSYGGVEPDERKDYENEVGAAFKGYSKGLMDIAQLLVNGKQGKWDGETVVSVINEYVTTKFNGKTQKEHPFRITEIPSTKMEGYIRTTVKEEMMRKGCSAKDAERYVNIFIEQPMSRENIIDQFPLDSIRVCEHCGQPMCEGYMVNDFDTYCSEECARAATKEMGWTKEQFDEQLANADSEDSCVYWTQWEG